MKENGGDTNKLESLKIERIKDELPAANLTVPEHLHLKSSTDDVAGDRPKTPIELIKSIKE